MARWAGVALVLDYAPDSKSVALSAPLRLIQTTTDNLVRYAQGKLRRRVYRARRFLASASRSLAGAEVSRLWSRRVTASLTSSTARPKAGALA